MAAVHQSMAVVHQPLDQPMHAIPFYGKHFSQPRPLPTPSRKAAVQAHRHIWVVAGTSCCGKTTIASKLAKQFGVGNHIEGDDYHPAANKRKMSSGQPLNDDDRAPWLKNLSQIAVKGAQSASNVVVTCSSLKLKYRDVFRAAERADPSVQVHFLFLIAPEGVLIDRAASRPGHFFKGPDMIKSQFHSLELPDELTERDVLLMDCTKSQASVEASVWDRVQGILTADRY